ncbi:MAG TPA: hypothetical protein VGM51_06855 [Armatimonadota bacterium]
MYPKYRLLAAGLILTGLIFVCLPASAQVLTGPAGVNIQGRLTKADGTALPDGPHTISLSLWDAASAGAQKFTETLTGVSTVSGLFSAQLATLTPGVVNGSLWVEFQVDADPPMAPRAPLTSAASALKANTVPDGAIGSAQLASDAASLAKASGGALNAVSGNIGVGTTSPGAQLHVNIAGGPGVGIFSGDLAPFGAAPFETNLSGPATHAWYAEKGARVYSVTGGGQGYFKGSVGIGTISPLQTLDVIGRMNIANGVIQKGGAAIDTTSDLGLYSQVGGDSIRFVTTAAPFQFYTDGGIGTTPIFSIAANGNVAATGSLSANSLTMSSATIPTLNGNVSVTGALSAGSLSVTSAAIPTLSGNVSVTGALSVGSLSMSSATIPTLLGNVSVTGALTAAGGLKANAASGISAGNTLEFGAGVAGKDVNAGKIGYETFTADSLDIVGAGTTGLSRKIKFWNEGGATFAGEVFAPVVTITGGSDVAEPYNVANAGDVKPLPGMVVALDADHIGWMRVASSAYDKAVAGILSGANGIAPGITLRQTGTIADGALPVASIGRVWCYCDADANGSIVVGDMLTTSDTPGHAMRATDRERRDGAVIGKAMSPLASGKGLVLVLVSLK